MTITFEAEYNYGDLVSLKSDKSVTYTVTAYGLYPNLVMYEISNSEGKSFRHGCELEPTVKTGKIGLK